MIVPRTLGVTPRILLGASGVALWLGGLISYARTGSSGGPIILWVLALAITLAALVNFPEHKRTLPALTTHDFVAVLFLLIAFVPLYTVSVYEIPWQVNTDEVTIMLFSERIASSEETDPVGLSDYFGFPSLPFFVFGKIANLMGGMSLLNMRTIHAWSGVLIIVAGYLFLRAFLGRTWAVVGASLIGVNHSLLAISRMAMRDNTGLLIELLALGALAWGLNRKSFLLTFLGGIFTGLTFYTYYPSRITLVIWFAFLAGGVLFMRKQIPMKTAVRFGACALFGFFFAVAPLGIATLKNSGQSLSYPRQQFLFFPEGQELQVEWSGGLPVREAIIENISQGIATFNAPIHDHGYIYPNYGHGFVDPLTGVILWIGAAVAVLRIIARDDDASGDLLALVGFFMLYLSFSFLITKAPNYTRLLVTLPFVAYLGAVAIREGAGLLTAPIHRLKKIRSFAVRLIAFGTVLAVFALNMNAFMAFAAKGYSEGNDVGSTGRYAEAGAGIPNYSFYLMADASFPYYSWGNDYQWRDWLGFFAGGSERVKVIKPWSLEAYAAKPPFTMFLSGRLFELMEPVLQKHYPGATYHRITPSGTLMAIEKLK